MKKLINACDELRALSSLFSHRKLVLTPQEADGVAIIIKKIEKNIRKYIEKKTDKIKIQKIC